MPAPGKLKQKEERNESTPYLSSLNKNRGCEQMDVDKEDDDLALGTRHRLSRHKPKGGSAKSTSRHVGVPLDVPLSPSIAIKMLARSQTRSSDKVSPKKEREVIDFSHNGGCPRRLTRFGECNCVLLNSLFSGSRRRNPNNNGNGKRKRKRNELEAGNIIEEGKEVEVDEDPNLCGFKIVEGLVEFLGGSEEKKEKGMEMFRSGMRNASLLFSRPSKIRRGNPPTGE